MPGFEAVGFSLGEVFIDYSLWGIGVVGEVALFRFSGCECLRFSHELLSLLDSQLPCQPDAGTEADSQFHRTYHGSHVWVV